MKLGRFGKFGIKDDEDNTRDYYDGTYEEEPPKPPRPKPDEPEYYEQEESRWEHLRISRRGKVLLTAAGSVAAAVLAWLLYVCMFVPRIQDATMYGYVETIYEQRGKVFKTGEGVILPYKSLMDTTRVYREDFAFSVKDEEVSKMLKKYEIEVRPVRVQYNVYRWTMPWNGESKVVVTSVNLADPAKILPPEFTPEYYRERKDTTDTDDNRVRQERIENM